MTDKAEVPAKARMFAYITGTPGSEFDFSDVQRAYEYITALEQRVESQAAEIERLRSLALTMYSSAYIAEYRDPLAKIAETKPSLSARGVDVLVTGGRDYRDRRRVFEELDAIHAQRTIRLVIEGGASGADDLALQWGAARYVPVVSHFADWQSYYKQAGPIRNGEMLRWWQPHLIVAFPGGSGTANMVAQGRAKGIEVVSIAETKP